MDVHRLCLKISPAIVHNKELLAIVHTFKVWCWYLTGADVTVRTDHKSLQFIRAQPTLNPRHIRWLDYLESNFHYKVTYKRGVSNIADALTRPSVHTAVVLITQANPLLTGLFTHGYSTDPFFTTNSHPQYGTRLHLSTAYHPQSDGQTERTNQTMEQLIRMTCTDPALWEDSLPLIEFAYNSAPTAPTTQSPFFLNYGIEPTTPLSPPIENPAPSQPST
ncbi:hypothetical protein CLOP_g19193 [Closterium sp. NIES-67]|nr:hypothetical protein CLOP_g19193 [Closterium sp. NIES-67]